jgi:AcrR family transcriptional regulator
MAKTAGRPPRSDGDIAEYRSKIANHALAIYRAEGFDAVSMRRLAKEVGCAPMTIYAHFEGKPDILRYLWADVLADVSNDIQEKLALIAEPVERLQMAAQTFVSYWVDHPDHFRLVFMSNDVTRSDVSTFVKDDRTLGHFQMFTDLVQVVLQNDSTVKASTDTLISGMIGIALCINTVRDYPWADSTMMTDSLLKNIKAPANCIP